MVPATHVDHEESEELEYSNPLENLFPTNFSKRLEEKGIIFINDAITTDTLSGPSAQLLALHYDDEWPDDKEVQIIINSPGGYCAAGFAFIDLMNFVRFPIRTVAIGNVASMGAMIFINGDERVISDNCQVLIHQFSGGNYGNYADLLAGRKMEDDLHKIFIKNLIKNSNYKTEEELKKTILSDKDVWLSAQEAVVHGLADNVAKERPKRRPVKDKKTRKAKFKVKLIRPKAKRKKR